MVYQIKSTCILMGLWWVAGFLCVFVTLMTKTDLFVLSLFGGCNIAAGWNLTGRDLGCCGNYEGCCRMASKVCYLHDSICQCCRLGWIFCGPECKPETECLSKTEVRAKQCITSFLLIYFGGGVVYSFLFFYWFTRIQRQIFPVINLYSNF